MDNYPKEGIKPLCGNAWLWQHQNDHSREEIEDLSIVVGIDGRKLPPVHAGEKRGKVKKNIKELTC
ncbi:unnamed protein product [marine sediment metagenome]|uniref:Uncharacterized protein n=1 Tax=marine sediment metagenome TaxID=412755 RepID=X1VE02_9ZZZZ